MINIHQIEFATPEYDESVALRYEVLRKPLGLEYSTEQLSAEWSDIHLAAFDAWGKMIGILLLSPINMQEVKMRQVAVAPEQQGRGVGAGLGGCGFGGGRAGGEQLGVRSAGGGQRGVRGVHQREQLLKDRNRAQVVVDLHTQHQRHHHQQHQFHSTSLKSDTVAVAWRGE